ncbi:MAG: formimidoylglutamase [Saprospiraceae bacterium]|nr:formimidoylglutamase [Saprospiraceae bacterium]
MKLDLDHYRAPDIELWSGRSDGGVASRFHEIVKPLSLLVALPQAEKKNFALLGFACDEGVIRNQGRPGAVLGPNAFRMVVGSMPRHGAYEIVDAGDILCDDGELEKAQANLAGAVFHLLNHRYVPILIGGGHEMAVGHWIGISEFLQKKESIPQLGVINFDAHLDLREPLDGKGNSGTSFYQVWQLGQQKGMPFSYLPIGIQRSANTEILLHRAAKWGVNPILAEQMHTDQSTKEIANFLREMDWVYLTICLDVFSAAVAPGVSAASPLGISPQGGFLHILRSILCSGKVISCDIAELNPVHDINNLTAKLAASLCWEIMEYLND